MHTHTLVYLRKETEICLAYKKRGLGEGNYNGFGGKIETGETVKEAAVREVLEESLVTVKEEDLEQVGKFTFYFADGMTVVGAMFFAKHWQGEPQETDEMKPEWFSTDAIPYDQMWQSDVNWLPRLLAGEKLVGESWLAPDGATFTKEKYTSVNHL